MATSILTTNRSLSAQRLSERIVLMCHFTLLFCCKHSGLSYSKKDANYHRITSTCPLHLAWWPSAWDPQTLWPFHLSHLIDSATFHTNTRTNTSIATITKTVIFAETTSRLSRPAGSLTLSAPKAGYFVELLLLKLIFNRLLQKQTSGGRKGGREGYGAEW
jgi:hypothetical protein